MRKLLFAAIAVTFFGFASCKKDHTCTCTVSGNGQTYSTNVTIHETKSKAKDACDALDGSANGITTSCEID